MRQMFSLLLVFLSLALPGQASKCTYTVECSVKDLVSNKLIPNASIEVVASDKSKKAYKTTNGTFTFELECQQSYWVYANAKGYETARGRMGSWHGEKKSILEFELNKTVDCDAYWKKADSIKKIKLAHFQAHILKKALASEQVSRANQNFLKALFEDLQKDKKARFSRATPTLPLFPVFKLEENHLGVFCNSKYERTKDNTYVDVTLESKVAQLTDYFKDSGMERFGKLIHYPPLLDSLVEESQKEVYIFTDKRRTTASLTSFGIYADECLDYYHYPLSTDNISKDDKVLFGSTYPLDLIFQNFEAIDHQFRKQFAGNCMDCGFQYEAKKTFAKLQGVDDLYWVYADSFPLNNELDFPLRGLYVRLQDGTMVSLWYEDLDLFGCACL